MLLLSAACRGELRDVSVTVSLQPGTFSVERVVVPPNLPLAAAPRANRRVISGSLLLATAASYSTLWAGVKPATWPNLPLAAAPRANRRVIS